MKQLQDLNLLDDFLFGTLVAHPHFQEPFSRILLETILQKKVGRLKIIPQKTYYGKDMDLHGMRLDIFMEETPKGNETGPISIYDMEPDRKPGTIPELARRTRFYHALMDTECLKSGAKYSSLKNVVIIFIMPVDPFGEERMVYTVRTMCEELPGLPYDDGARTLFLYTNGKKGSPPKALRQLLHYMECSTQECAVNGNLKKLHHMVESVKQDREVELSYMKVWEQEERLRAEAHEEGFAEGHAKGLEKGLEEGLEQGLKKGLEQGLEQGRLEEQKNTEREKRRANLAEEENKRLLAELRKYRAERTF